MLKYRNLKRYREIAQVLFKYGFGYVVERVGLSRFFRGKREFVAYPRLSGPERIRKMLEELGPTFVKLGQVLSVRPDLIPFEYVLEFRKLQDHVSPLPFEVIKEEIERELKRPIDELFEWIDPVPIASASIAQVHKGKIRDTDKFVVLKVQRPGIERIVESDLDIMYHFASLIKRHFSEELTFDPEEVADEFANAIRKELDFDNEKRNIKRFARFYGDDPYLVVPNVYEELSTSKLLVIDYIDGIKPESREVLIKHGIDPDEVVRRGAHLVFRQIFVVGFFHSDPHPGNILVLKDGRLAFLDFGQMGRVHEDLVSSLCDVLSAFLRKDTAGIIDILIEMGVMKAIPPTGLRTALRDFIEDYYDIPLGEIKLGKLIDEMNEISLKYGLRLPKELVLLSKAIATLEGMGANLSPSFNFLDAVKGEVFELYKRRYSSFRVSSLWKHGLRELDKVFLKFPYALSSLLKVLEGGKITVKLESDGRDEIAEGLKTLSRSVLLGFLFLGFIYLLPRISRSDLKSWAVLFLFSLAGFILGLIVKRGG
ncbi:MAG: AarF/ABC1/UbiB kinase family protein [Synergistetes bacterium]|nr:AarF/ABC1/UbiB kinase family protein [Synergistota bacterium]MDW8191693.1 AarF/ABC1/UbiB kinase family protein [Synergistota bacterium]